MTLTTVTDLSGKVVFKKVVSGAEFSEFKSNARRPTLPIDDDCESRDGLTAEVTGQAGSVCATNAVL